MIVAERLVGESVTHLARVDSFAAMVAGDDRLEVLPANFVMKN
jgi:hypothetical protein